MNDVNKPVEAPKPAAPTSAAPVQAAPPEFQPTDKELALALLRSCRMNKMPRLKPHWRYEAIAYNLGITEEKARDLCKRFGLNPDERVARE